MTDVQEEIERYLDSVSTGAAISVSHAIATIRADYPNLPPMSDLQIEALVVEAVGSFGGALELDRHRAA